MYTITFIELPPFTRHLYRYMSDEEYQDYKVFSAPIPTPAM